MFSWVRLSPELEGSAARARALGLCAHVPNRPFSHNLNRRQDDAPPSGCEIREAQCLAYCLSRCTSKSFIVARQTKFRNKFPTVGALGVRVIKRPSAMRRFEINSPKPSFS